jgi:formate hydrogenlyase subunit 3/multisubunit Na+/H+ antiporter MnhD subunit
LLHWLVIIPVLGALLVARSGDKHVRLRNTWCLLPCAANFIIVLRLSKGILAGERYFTTLVRALPFSIEFMADGFAVYMGLLVSFLWFLTMIYSFGYMVHEHAHTRYYTALMLAFGSTMGIIFSSNLVTFFIFFEGLTFSVYPLVIHEESDEAYRAGSKYGVYLISGGVMILLATVAVHALTDGARFTPGGMPALAGQSKGVLFMLFGLFTVGFGFKAALMPLHSWLPDAMIAPTPVSAVLHAVAVVNVGLYGFYRVIYTVFGVELYQRMGFGTWLAVAASITIITAALMALRQNEIKRMLAYSTVNQLSYVLLGIVSFQMIGMLGAMLHIVYHSFMKITLFYAAGTIITQSGNKYIGKMEGLAKEMPITMLAFSVAAIGIIGLPPVAGWVSKWYIMQGFLQRLSLSHIIFAGVFILSSIIELGYFTPPIYLAYFGGGEKHSAPAKLGSEAPLTMIVPMVIVACASLLFGIWGLAPHWLAKPALAGLMGQIY